MVKSELFKKLSDDVDSLAKRFISIYNLKYSGNVSNLSSPVTRWLDFRMRYVSPRPRQIVYSNVFPKSLSPEIQEAWEFLEDKIKRGEDINPYQGRGLIDGNDTSGTNPNKRTDLLWASWGILHFHLTKNPVKAENYFSDRSGYQVFASFDDEAFAVIDILPHPIGDGYSDPNFLNIIAESWPAAIEHAEIKGDIVAGNAQTAAEISTYRKLGVNTLITIKGKNYMNPGIGLTSAGTSLNLQIRHIQLNDAIRILAELIEKDPLFSRHIKGAGYSKPIWGMTITEGGATLYEKNSMSAFRVNIPNLPSLSLLFDFLFPDWAVKEYMNSSFADNL